MAAQTVFSENNVTLWSAAFHSSNGWRSCAAAPVDLIRFQDFPNRRILPADYDRAGSTGMPTEVGVFAVGSNKQLDSVRPCVYLLPLGKYARQARRARLCPVVGRSGRHPENHLRRHCRAGRQFDDFVPGRRGHLPCFPMEAGRNHERQHPQYRRLAGSGLHEEKLGSSKGYLRFFDICQKAVRSAGLIQ